MNDHADACDVLGKNLAQCGILYHVEEVESKRVLQTVV